MPRHISVQTMKAYLLGKLPSEQSLALEERYFVDRSFFLHLEREENALISDYVAGRLSSGDRKRFEDRYLGNPLLNEKVQRARASQPAASSSGYYWGRALPAVAALVMVVISGLAVRWYKERTVSTPAVVAQLGSPLEFHLSPGVVKGPDDPRDSEIRTPLPPGGVRLWLELPGVTSPVLVRGSVWRIEPDGRRSRVWSLPAARQTSIGQNRQQQLPIDIPSALLPPGDYLAEVTSASSVTNASSTSLETYLFRVVGAR